MIKLNIEMSMAALISKIARSQDGSTPTGDEYQMTKNLGGRHGRSQAKGHAEDHGDTMEASKKRFDPTVSEVMAEGDTEQRMYHAWVSADSTRYREAPRDLKSGFGIRGRTSGPRFDGDDVEHQGRIRKETEGQVIEEGPGDTTAKREPSEDGSTIQLKP